MQRPLFYGETGPVLPDNRELQPGVRSLHEIISLEKLAPRLVRVSDMHHPGVLESLRPAENEVRTSDVRWCDHLDGQASRRIENESRPIGEELGTILPNQVRNMHAHRAGGGEMNLLKQGTHQRRRADLQVRWVRPIDSLGIREASGDRSKKNRQRHAYRCSPCHQGGVGLWV